MIMFFLSRKLCIIIIVYVDNDIQDNVVACMSFSMID